MLVAVDHFWALYFASAASTDVLDVLSTVQSGIPSLAQHAGKRSSCSLPAGASALEPIDPN